METLIVLLICLIVIPVLSSNYQFLPDVIASEGTENGDPGDTEGDTQDESETESGGEESGGLDEPGEESGGLDPVITEGPSADLSGSEERANSDIDSQDDNSNDDRFRHNAEEIALELASLSPEEISEYPITDLSDKDITLVFRYLTPDNLAKVLLNIDQESLVEIKDRLTPADFDGPLNRISEVDRTQVLGRLVLTSTN